jgi:hypothetical protein
MGSPLPESNPRCCSECGAEVPPAAAVCWVCRRQLTICDLSAAQNAAAKRQTPAAMPSAVVSLLLIVTLAVILLSVFAIQPGVGIVLAVLVLPAFIRTVVLAMQKRARGKLMSVQGKIGFFLVWMGLACIIILVIGASLFAALFVICASQLNPNDTTQVLYLIGIAATIVVVLLLVLFRWIVKRF